MRNLAQLVASLGLPHGSYSVQEGILVVNRIRTETCHDCGGGGCRSCAFTGSHSFDFWYPVLIDGETIFA